MIKESADLHDDPKAFRDALIDTEFLSGCWVDLDIDWDTITTILPASGTYASVGELPEDGSDNTVYLVTEGSNVRAYTWDVISQMYIKSDTVTTGTNIRSYHACTVRIFDENNHKVFTAMKESLYFWMFTLYSSSDDYVAFSFGGSSSNNAQVKYCYSCTNGIIIQYVRGYSPFIIRIVKTNNDKLAIIMPEAAYGLPAGYINGLHCVAFGDIPEYKTFTISNRYNTSYQVIPMLTNSDGDVLSYTEKSGFLSGSTQDGVIKAVTINSKRYLTDSYFAIED